MPSGITVRAGDVVSLPNGQGNGRAWGYLIDAGPREFEFMPADGTMTAMDGGSSQLPTPQRGLD